jgi:hypothetical protein
MTAYKKQQDEIKHIKAFIASAGYVESFSNVKVQFSDSLQYLW